MTISIWGRLSGKKPEKIDEASNWKEARYLVVEYRMAYGSSWVIWAGPRKNEPGKE